MEKKLYTITEKGKIELVEWLKKDEPLEITPKDKFRLRTYFSDFMSEETFENHLESQLKKHRLKLSYLNNIMQAEHKTLPPKGTKEFGDYVVLEEQF
jgi:DNA-binding PadR family transcriptional regulator